MRKSDRIPTVRLSVCLVVLWCSLSTLSIVRQFDDRIMLAGVSASAQAASSSPSMTTLTRLWGRKLRRKNTSASNKEPTQIRRKRWTSLLTEEQLDQFERDGYIVLSGLLDDEDVNRIVRAGHEAVASQANGQELSRGNTFSVVEKGMIFSPPPSLNTTLTPETGGLMSCDDTLAIFRKVALRSKLPQVAAELMQLDPKRQSLRILRDVFLAKPVNETEFCDWHVDDQGFWPAMYESEASKESGYDQHGINVWMALDDMPADYEGSMALSPGSHKAEWASDAYHAIGQEDRLLDDTRTLTLEDVADIFGANDPRGTCSMGLASPELRDRIESKKVVLNLRRGDVVFATRLLFHRTLSVTDEGREYFASIQRPTLNRYSIRYVPGTARIPTGYHFFEWSRTLDDSLGGKTLDEVSLPAPSESGEIKPLWYPKVWPSIDRSMDSRLSEVGSLKSLVKEKVNEERKALYELIQKRKAEGNIR